MRKIVFGINITTDGYCNHTDMIADEEVHKYFTRVLHNASLLLFGRITYQLMVPYWPDVARNQSESEATNEFARVFDSLDLVVFSTTLKHAEGNKTRIVDGNLAEEVLVLKQQPGKDICVGSLSIASQLSQRGLIDEYRFVVHPVVAGKGPRLFETVKPQGRLQLDFLGSENVSIRRRCPSLQKAHVSRNATRPFAYSTIFHKTIVPSAAGHERITNVTTTLIHL